MTTPVCQISGSESNRRPETRSVISAVLRIARREDVPAMMRVRHAVKENRLVSRAIPDSEVIDAIERSGRGWVIEVSDQIVAFAIGNADTGNVWALFVDPAYEGKGHGRRLLEEMTGWLFDRGLERLWLSTEAQTRAHVFYERAGWQWVRDLPDREVLLEKLRRETT